MLASSKIFVNERAVYGIPCDMLLSRKSQIEWLEDALKTANMTVTALAQKAKIDPSTIYKFQSGENEVMRERTLRRIAQVANIALPETPGLAEGDGAAYDITKMPDMSDISGDDRYFALKIKSAVIEQAGIEPGDILVFDHTAQPQSGDIICAQITDYRLGTADTIVRLYDKPYLIALSNNPEHRRPLIVDDDRVQIRGVLIKQIRVKLFRNVA